MCERNKPFVNNLCGPGMVAQQTSAPLACKLLWAGTSKLPKESVRSVSNKGSACRACALALI